MKIISFDVEEWFHLLNKKHLNDQGLWHQYPSRIENQIDKILYLLNNYQIKATFFCLGWVAKKYPELIKKIHNCGHQIGSHSYAHQLISYQTKTEFLEDLKKSIYCLEEIIGEKVICFRAPGFSINKLN